MTPSERNGISAQQNNYRLTQLEDGEEVESADDLQSEFLLYRRRVVNSVALFPMCQTIIAIEDRVVGVISVF